MKYVDVIINVYGKPWQTLCTLKSLMKHSGKYIDKIYIIEEKQQPYDDNVDFIIKYFNNVIHYIPSTYEALPRISRIDNLLNKEYRYKFRYQYGIENSDKKYVFITHNDILYTGDIIGEMLNEIYDCAGIGLIGQCWNCPCYHANECNCEKFNEYRPTYEKVIELCKQHTPARESQFISMIDKNMIMPLPECRLNEFACLINREITMSNCIPNGNVFLFGEYSGIDIASEWFKGLLKNGYNFKNYNIDRTSIHAFYSKSSDCDQLCGNSVLLNISLYEKSEDFAEKYYLNNLA